MHFNTYSVSDESCAYAYAVHLTFDFYTVQFNEVVMFFK